ncbi:hypothetical protein F0U60_20360 [Archangium minus]|uniref:Uncharacterized protein n=1 Tax=Archangium minus TaxID=83450 RepID=A0ABY9WQX6_9BACT|nr:hypothetical protein F0U61_20435 [Archangium violaceum]WNG46209.1 hypothetical protein F0U60_20360 [Archangium minus]
MRFRLPVSGLEVRLRPPAGAEDLLLAEARSFDAQLALALVERLGERAEGGPVDWAALPLTDLDTTLLRLRQGLVGDHVRADVVCGPDGCGARVDIAFRIRDYLAHHAPRALEGLEAAAEPGWYALQGTAAVFRLPSGTDQLAIAFHPEGEEELARRCIRPAGLAPSLRERVEAAMEALAPNLCSELEGPCPECGASVRAAFDPQRYVLQELRAQATRVYEDIHLIARTYHWTEDAILALPHHRRALYAEHIRQERSGS